MNETLPVDNSNVIMSPILKILIVDDEEDICYFLSRNLTRRGYITSISHSLAEAQLQLDRSKPDILLLDNHLPDGKGIDFVKKVNYKYPDLKIVMITAHDDPEDRSKAYNNGVKYFLSKPFSITTINQVVDLIS